MKRDLLEDLKNGKYNRFDPISSIDPYFYDGIYYGMPVDGDARLRQHFVAAIIKYKNSDEEYENILDDLDINDFSDEKHSPKESMIWHSIANSLDISTSFLSDLETVLLQTNHTASTGETYYFLSMTRIVESFKSSILLLRSGFFVEVTPIYRLIYEQLCWACFVIDEDSMEKIKANKTTKNTKYLKEKINDEYGKIYDDLSKDSHLAVERLGKYLGVTDDKQIVINRRSGAKCKAETNYLLLLYKIYIEVFSYSVNKHFPLSDDDRVYYNEYLNVQFNLYHTLVMTLKGKANLRIIHQKDENK